MTPELEAYVKTGNVAAIAAHMAVSLRSIAESQAELVQLAKADMETVIDQEAQQRAQVLADAEKEAAGRRTFIGKKPQI
jgi:hypothetical protein